MPEQSHPPYVSGATTIPRQLQRWLDVNPQNGRLKRTETFIQVPTFNIDHVWNGYSEIVGEFHYTSPNQLSLKLANLANILPSQSNYTLCVSYVSGVGTVARYSLVRGQGDLFYFDLEPYEGQRIINDFVIEIWNTSQVQCSETANTTVYTSVAGNLDYRYGVDGQLAVATSLCNGQQPPGTTTLMPIGTNLTLWLDGGNGWSSDAWVDRTVGTSFPSNTGLSTVIPPNDVQLSGSTYTGLVVNPKSMWIYVTVGSDNTLSFLHTDDGGGGTADIGLNALNQLFVTHFPSAITSTGTYVLQLGSSYVIYFEGSNTLICALYDAVTLTLLDFFMHDNIPLNVNITLRVGTVGKDFSVRAVLAYNDSSIQPFYSDSVFPYMQSLPSGAVVMTFPLVFDPCGTHPNLPPVGIIAVG